MKKVVFISAIIFISLFGFCMCNYDHINPTLYEGIFWKGGSGCPNVVSITKSISGGLPVNANLDALFSDSTQLKQLQDGEAIQFKILDYGPDTNVYLAICLMPQYVATIELGH